MDNEYKIIREYAVTDASVHDSQVFEDILDEDNSNKEVYADSAYRSEEAEAFLKEQGYRSKIHRKGKRNKPLTKREPQGNRTKSQVRVRVEHIFGSIVTSMGESREAGHPDFPLVRTRRAEFPHRAHDNPFHPESSSKIADVSPSARVADWLQRSVWTAPMWKTDADFGGWAIWKRYASPFR